MTAQELRDLFSHSFGIGPWPATFEVDAETYANVETWLRAWSLERYGHDVLFSGPNFGVMFKGVELIERASDTSAKPD